MISKFIKWVRYMEFDLGELFICGCCTAAMLFVFYAIIVDVIKSF